MNKFLKKILIIITVVVTPLVGCRMVEKDMTIKSNPSPIYREREYYLDTLDNGHILMKDIHSMDAGFIDYPECPKCRENLKEIITEVVDSIIDDKVVKLLGIEYDLKNK